MTSTVPNITITTLVDSFKHSFSSKYVSDTVLSTFVSNNTNNDNNGNNNTNNDGKQPNQLKLNYNILPFAVSDGGEGFIESMSVALKITPLKHTIIGPLQTNIEVSYLYDPVQQLIILESAQGVGIQDVPKDKLNPSVVSSYGVGLQLRYILETHQYDYKNGKIHYDENNNNNNNGSDNSQNTTKCGVKTIILGLGGTASVDCGLGLLYGLLDIKCYRKDENNNKILTNGPFDVCLNDIVDIDFGCTEQSGDNNNNNTKILEKLTNTTIMLASDVTNPLLGPNGAAYIFGPQKGLKKENLAQWEQGMEQFSQLLQKLSFSPSDLYTRAGCGAAGGIGFALYCLMYYSLHLFGTNNRQVSSLHNNDGSEVNVVMRSGFDLLCEHTPIMTSVQQNAIIPNISSNSKHKQYPNQIIITGEGSFDEQSLDGKVIDRVCNSISKINAQNNARFDCTNNNYDDDNNNNNNNVGGDNIVNIPVILLCGHNNFNIENPSLVNFTDHPLSELPHEDGTILNGGSDNDQIHQNKALLGKMNIVKIININDTKYHRYNQSLGSNMNSTEQTSSVVTLSLEEKLKNGPDNVKSVMEFLYALFGEICDNNQSDNIIEHFIQKLRSI